MNKEFVRSGKIYKGFTYEGKEKLLEEVFSKRVGWYYYLDLETNKYLNYNDIDKNSLKLYAFITGFQQNKKRRKVINLYKKRREEVFNAEQFVYADILDKDSNNVLESNVLLYQTDKGFLDCINNIFYPLDDAKFIVDNIRDFKELEGVVTKKKVLEFNYARTNYKK